MTDAFRQNCGLGFGQWFMNILYLGWYKFKEENPIYRIFKLSIIILNSDLKSINNFMR